MNKLKHTQGPWNIESKFDATQVLISSKDQFICNTLYSNDEANARLIACAPEMLDMVISLYTLINPSGLIEVQMRHLIEKATGIEIKEVLMEDKYKIS